MPDDGSFDGMITLKSVSLRRGAKTLLDQRR
jgi:hypothetical protein